MTSGEHCPIENNRQYKVLPFHNFRAFTETLQVLCFRLTLLLHSLEGDWAVFLEVLEVKLDEIVFLY